MRASAPFEAGRKGRKAALTDRAARRLVRPGGADAEPGAGTKATGRRWAPRVPPFDRAQQPMRVTL